jgi:hypothetical protein
MHKALATLGLAASCGLAVGALAAPAQAAPPSANQAIPMECADGSTVLAHLDPRGLSTPVAWVEGRGIVARAFDHSDVGTLALFDGTAVAVDLSTGPGKEGPGGSTRPVAVAALSGTTVCTIAEDVDFTFTLEQWDVDFLSLPAEYLGTEAHFTGQWATDVYIGATQLAARS